MEENSRTDFIPQKWGEALHFELMGIFNTVSCLGI